MSLSVSLCQNPWYSVPACQVGGPPTHVSRVCAGSPRLDASRPSEPSISLIVKRNRQPTAGLRRRHFRLRVSSRCPLPMQRALNSRRVPKESSWRHFGDQDSLPLVVMRSSATSDGESSLLS